MPTEEELRAAKQLICDVEGHWSFNIEMESEERQVPKFLICSKCGRRWCIGEEVT